MTERSATDRSRNGPCQTQFTFLLCSVMFGDRMEIFRLFTISLYPDATMRVEWVRTEVEYLIYVQVKGTLAVNIGTIAAEVEFFPLACLNSSVLASPMILRSDHRHVYRMIEMNILTGTLNWVAFRTRNNEKRRNPKWGGGPQDYKATWDRYRQKSIFRDKNAVLSKKI